MKLWAIIRKYSPFKNKCTIITEIQCFNVQSNQAKVGELNLPLGKQASQMMVAQEGHKLLFEIVGGQLSMLVLQPPPMDSST